MKSKTINVWQGWLSTASAGDVETVDSVYAAAEQKYNSGGKRIVEEMTPTEILKQISENRN